MVKKILIVAVSVIALALIATGVAATYASVMMPQQRSSTTSERSQGQFGGMMQGTSMENMHDSGYYNSMMGNYTQGGMMGSSNHMGWSSTGSGGCP